MSDDLIESELGDSEIQKLSASLQDIRESSRLAAQKALAFFENIADGIKSVNKANDAQEEYIRLATRAAKARGKQYGDIVDIDYSAKKIVFKKREVLNAEDTDEGREAGTPSEDEGA